MLGQVQSSYDIFGCYIRLEHVRQGNFRLCQVKTGLDVRPC